MRLSLSSAVCRRLLTAGNIQTLGKTKTHMQKTQTVTQSNTPIDISKYSFTCGWSYKIFCAKNGLAMSDDTHTIFLAVRKEAWQKALERQKEMQLHDVREKAVYVAKANKFVVQQTVVARGGTPTREQVEKAIETTKAQSAKRLAAMLTASLLID